MGSSNTAMLPSGLPEAVGDIEPLARFLTSTSLFSGDLIKAAALMPNPKNGETSVFRHGGRPSEEFWSLSAPITAGGRTIHGAAMLAARQVRDIGLDVMAIEPPNRHANILGWTVPGSDPELAKARNREMALVLARHATLMRP